MGLHARTALSRRSPSCLVSDLPAVEAMAVVDAPAFHELALRFPSNNPCESIASEYLGGHLLDEHAFRTVVGSDPSEDLPGATKKLLEFIGTDSDGLFRQDLTFSSDAAWPARDRASPR